MVFLLCEGKNLPEELKGRLGFGDVWTWTALDADTKLIVSFVVGGRSAAAYARKFIEDLASRLASRVQLTTDGHKAYLTAVKMRLALRLIMRYWRKSIRLRLFLKFIGTAQLSAVERSKIRSMATLTCRRFQQAMWSGRPHHADEYPANDAADPMLSARSWRTRPMLWLCTLCTITSVGFIRH
jgi:hypothetical protein